ncbi:hypothetical protein SODALDRAFT_280002 [Sodiomyces alkalinus F11]|uniref:Heterokaryon incompatibility domain-containing protein n=1 Tax=Sodiomyces alkalinus (strain CBS 110278 / VKM F-3762 / F11) TaxID=1314773 RepID=A0A3N2PRK6_SODAK|nr:hypothetical protein SODALDRAFT_280002 [Sodiomyces alkalinus F11]ROT37151.1 hypothetical protein SODALDRAFT_280002 [Sodiomyces alkalinus F11]
MAAVIFWSAIGFAHVVKKHRDKRPYKHSAASIDPERRKETRILTLVPGSFLDDLRGEIHTVSLDDPIPSHLPYEAVSHGWVPSMSNNNKSDCVKIGSSSRRLWLPQYLGTMLRYLRHKDRPRNLWVDYICIDQHNLAEKAQHVAMMRDVYASAARVVVWLGQEADDSTAALSLLEDLGWMVEFDFENHARMRPSPAAAAVGGHSHSWADPAVPLPYDQDDLWSIYHLVHRPWFGRLWSRLHIAAAAAAADPAATVVVVCGNKVASWDLLRNAFACVANKRRHYLDRSADSQPELRFARRFEMLLLFLCQGSRGDGGNTGDYTFAELLDQGRKFSCEDPRERVHAALGMASDVDADLMGLLPDYTVSKAQVYRDAVLRYIAHAGDANILASCEMVTSSSTTALDERLPSWVPDWCVKRAANRMPMHLASGLSGAHVEFIPDSDCGGILRAAGIRCATVKSARLLFADLVPLPDVVAAVRRCAPTDVLTARYRPRRQHPEQEHDASTTTLLEAYCAVLAWGLFASSYHPAVEAYPDLEASVDALKTVLTTVPREEGQREGEGESARGSDSYDSVTLGFATHLLASCRGRAVLTTEEGYIGLGPRETRPGDRIVVLLGCDVPLVLRQVRSSRSATAGEAGEAVVVVGDCYVEGLMTGEALLGPLPEGMRIVMDCEDSEEQATPIFVHGKGVWNGEGEDPRIDRVRGLTKGECEKRELVAMEDLLTPPNLRAVGVNVVRMDLV